MSPIIELIETSTPYLTFVLTIFGLIVGSFLNVVIHRLPIMMERQWQQQSEAILHPEKIPDPLPAFNLVVPASTCPSCQHKIRAWENIPVISYLFLRGKCSACRTPISLRYPAIEILSALMTIMIGLTYGVTLQTLVFCLFGWSLLALTMIDYDTQLLPDDITLPLLWTGLIVNSFGLVVSLEQALWGAIAGYLSLWSVYWVFKLVTGKEGMGYGDFKLLAALGAWLGWMKLPLIILLSSLVGTVAAILLIVSKRQERSNPIPFGPYLAIAGFVALVWGDQLIAVYLSFSGLNG
ncbi:A24 family peptidase [Endozoicomonas sp. GU-1]|uniref:prepilin peptidase n=1 Tax=Endozoicomonas sp. GU-1 TaxID=3009078 RepID=UPI0022B4D24C|nr:A24 family peptidase [Endozoicomonas sp. GU-1]WBA82725.1 A24 family peptidase [Endozoicomonas sp. GU-1]WBA85656.1 A24 family peptidase [Endozoicomonas sp. GU-1]